MDSLNCFPQICMVYYLYDGFFQTKEFEPEEEVRLLVKVLWLDHYPEFWKDYHIKFQDGVKCARQYLYLPISMDFGFKTPSVIVKVTEKHFCPRM